MEDPYDIIRDIDTDKQSDVVREIDRLWNRKRIGLKASFTRNCNTLKRIMVSAMFGRDNPEEEGPFDTTRSTKDNIISSYNKCQAAYEKLSLLHERVLEINMNTTDNKVYQDETGRIYTAFNDVETNYGALKTKILSCSQKC